jgi:hypothetical protein
MRGYIEIKEDQYEDTIEHLYRIKHIACKLMEKLQENSDVYSEDGDSDTEYYTKHVKKVKGRYDY